MICPKCGHDNAEGNLFCGKCATPLQEAVNSGLEADKKAKKSGNKMVIILAAIAVVAIIGVIVAVGVSKKQAQLKAEQIAAENRQRTVMTMMAKNFMQGVKERDLEKVHSYETTETSGMEMLENYIVETDEEMAAQILSMTLFGIGYDDLYEQSRNGIDELVDYNIASSLNEYVVHGIDIVDNENGTITVEMMGYGSDYEQGLNGTSLSKMEAVTKKLVEGYITDNKSRMQTFYITNGEKETVLYTVDMVIGDIVKECKKCMDESLADYNRQDECFNIHIKTINGQWKIASVEKGGVIPAPINRDSIESQSEEFQADYMMADMIHTSILTGMMDPEVVNEAGYADMIEMLKGGIVLTDITPGELYVMGEKSVLGTAAKILNTSDLSAYSEKLYSSTATGRIYVKAIGDNKLRVEIEGTGIVIE